MNKLHQIYEGSNLGSFYKLEIAHKHDFLNFNDQEILFRANRNWKEIEITDETGMYSFSETETDQGLITQCQGSFSLHGPIQQIAKKLRPYLGRKSIIRLTSLNREIIVLGDPGNPVSLSSNGSTGTKYTDSSQVVYSFTWDTPFFC